MTKVKELINALHECDLEAPIATHALGFKYSSDKDDISHGSLAVGITKYGEVMIGDFKEEDVEELVFKQESAVKRMFEDNE